MKRFLFFFIFSCFCCTNQPQPALVNNLPRVEKIYYVGQSDTLGEPSAAFREAIFKMTAIGYYPNNMEYAYFPNNFHHKTNNDLKDDFITSSWKIQLNRNTENVFDSNTVEITEFLIDRSKIKGGWNANEATFNSFLVMYFKRSFFDGDTCNAFPFANNYYVVNSVTINGTRAILNDSTAVVLSKYLEQH